MACAPRPLALGMVASWREFALFNALGATAWAVTFASLGHLFGRSVAAIVEEASRHEPQAAALIIVLGARGGSPWCGALCSGRATGWP
jgi:membrane protein DedA with SNARE-associated domain